MFVPGGLDIENLIKSPLIYSDSYFDLGVLGTLFGGLSSPKSPVATGLSLGVHVPQLRSPWTTRCQPPTT